MTLLRRILRSHRLSICLPAPQSRPFATTRPKQADFTHTVIGGGAVGLAIARRLAQVPSTSTLLVEKHHAVGTETSSRNPEVIHAGLYYGPTSLKTRLCLQGKDLLYCLCEAHRIPYRKCGKWIVAQNDAECAALHEIHSLSRQLGVPTRFVPTAEQHAAEPDIHASLILESPTTGILDSHAYCQFLASDLQDRGGDIALRSQVVHIDQLSSDSDAKWRVHIQSPNGETTSITTDFLINSAGLYACAINNMVLPPSRHRTPFYAKGSYYTYNARHPKPQRLIYPAPVAGHGGLGTHLTLDLQGGIRFGPDVEWVSSPTDLAPSKDPVRLENAVAAIRRFLPAVTPDALALGYAGIRPKLGKFGAAVVGVGGAEDAAKATAGGFQDFYIEAEEGFPGFVNLLAIESPGLTSSLAIGEYVHRLLYA